MHNLQYMKIILKYFTQEIQDEYNITEIAYKGYVYIKIIKGMYGLKEANILAFNYVVANLAPHRYYPVKHTVGLWKHKERQRNFFLCVDNSDIKYHGKDDPDYLLNALKPIYEISMDHTCANYICLNINWKYTKQHVKISMPLYITTTLLIRYVFNPPKGFHTLARMKYVHDSIPVP